MIEWCSLTKDEWCEYIALVDDFTKAKNQKLYLESDDIRKKLQRWNAGLSDQDFITMSETGKYIWYSIFESQGIGGHRVERIQKRLDII